MKNVYDVQKSLYSLLSGQNFEVGDRLPSERELAETLQTTRTTLRKIFDHLEKKGVIHKRNQAGTFLALPMHEVREFKLSGGEEVEKQNHIAVMLMNRKGAFESRIRWLQKTAMDHGHVVGTYLSGLDSQDPALEKMYFQSLVSSNIKGVLVHATPREPTNDPVLEDLRRSGMRVVHYDWHGMDLPDQAFFLPDLKLGGTLAVAQLLERGYKRVVSIFGNATSPMSRLMERGVHDTCESLGVEYLGLMDPGAAMMKRASFVTKIASLPASTGVVIYSARMAESLAEYCRTDADMIKKKHAIVAIDDYDVEDNPVPSVPLVGFSWRERISKALDFVLQDRPDLSRELLSPKLINPS